MDKDNKRNMGIGVFFLGASVLYLVGANSISTFSPFGNRGLDSQSIPQMIGIFGCALSILQIVLTRMKMKRQALGKSGSSAQVDFVSHCGMNGDNRLSETNETGEKTERERSFLLFASLGALVVYIFLFQKLGFILSTVLYLLSSATLLTPAKKRSKLSVFIAFFSISFPVLVYIVFTKYLTLFLPKGILG